MLFYFVLFSEPALPTSTRCPDRRSVIPLPSPTPPHSPGSPPFTCADKTVRDGSSKPTLCPTGCQPCNPCNQCGACQPALMPSCEFCLIFCFPSLLISVYALPTSTPVHTPKICDPNPLPSPSPHSPPPHPHSLCLCHLVPPVQETLLTWPQICTPPPPVRTNMF